jgi:flagellin
MERLATGKQNANAGDRSSYVAMADTFRMDFVGTKAGIKGGAVVMGYLETGMRVLDAASALLSRLQELAVLASNDSNTAADLKAIDAEAEAMGDEFHRLMSTSKYKGKDIFVTTAASEYVSMGGRNAEMTFGIGKIKYSNLYLHSYADYAAEADGGKLESLAAAFHPGSLVNATAATQEHKVAEAIKTTSIVDGVGYRTNKEGTDDDSGSDMDDFGGLASAAAGTVEVTNSVTGNAFTATGRGVLGSTGSANNQEVYKQTGQLLFAASEGLLESTPDTDMLTAQIEDVQAKVNTARVQAGSQYAAIESAVNYTTDLTAQYELGFNTVSDVNFSMETAHLAKNQILQQAATAMLAQANQGQQGLLQLIQG